MLKDKLRSKIYITDEGFGPIVRQSVIIEELKKLSRQIEFDLQLNTHIKDAELIIKDVNYLNKFNNIIWHKNLNGSPDIDSIRNFYVNYIPSSNNYISDELKNTSAYDFIISDFVYEAFDVADTKKIPSFGVAHFTWDWFFSYLVNKPISNELLDRFKQQAIKAKLLFFPPLTPKEILSTYKSKAIEVPFIVRKSTVQSRVSNDKFKILIIDSGAQVLKSLITKSLGQLSSLQEFEFYVSENFDFQSANFKKVAKSDLMVDHILNMDLVIGRAGFNTISECIAYRTPMLLIGEAMNPEMAENIKQLKSLGLGEFISIEDFKNNLAVFLTSFISTKYSEILSNMKNHQFEINGAEVIAKKIIENI
ncbi:MAG: hypothetical protein J0M08_11335 [Bacteroidetes bacterium]|nr:hypothetical protein [Bacteroidota bacterium]